MGNLLVHIKEVQADYFERITEIPKLLFLIEKEMNQNNSEDSTVILSILVRSNS